MIDRIVVVAIFAAAAPVAAVLILAGVVSGAIGRKGAKHANEAR